jgi:hypothetical protein
MQVPVEMQPEKIAQPIQAVILSTTYNKYTHRWNFFLV